MIMRYSTDNSLIIEFNPDTQLLSLCDVMPDGTFAMYTQISLSQLKEYGLEKACYEVGANILSSLPDIRTELF
jgi:hypothetical protein